MARTTPRPTLNEVADRAGVSPATASKALNGHDGVAATTTARVLDAAAALGYHTPGARNSPRRRAVELLVDKLDNPYITELLRGVTVAAEEAGADVVLGRVRPRAGDSRAESAVTWTRRLIAARRTGAIVVTAQVTEDTYANIARARLPVVVVDPLDLTTPELVSVGSTNWDGGRAAAGHLIGLGHRRMALIAGPETSMSAVARVEGFRSACARAGLPPGSVVVQHARFDRDAALAVAARVLARPDRPTAVAASSDTQALGVMEAARRLRLRIPDDLSVVGYDDTYLAAWTTPALTSVRQPVEEIGRVALRTVLRMADGELPDSHHIELATRLVVRESTAPPPDGSS
ncbi:LacI family transcriptional regulator [Cellulomonas hominis]|uniref:LacI family transcriptional regulator n=1 Tax=Cellulomonas hominis TaxID=156981 RepID=A0A511FF53_9CELL|nr:LacI family DNA-binding transcriptional regulator [Cellulomonas hominis]MBB5472797.1 LacI family transcriptional regulator [Cellulomonas hominis]NKY10051.1 LacI family transcriptional regulator [Cellulomonas hominis]GEL47843.1 LacI family transcriptional regulator [Cellulomonas hominis]